MTCRRFFLVLFLTLSLFSDSPDIAVAASSRVIEQYRNALKLAPDDINVRYLLGRSLIQHGDYAGGIEEFLRVYPEKKLEPEINYNLGYAYLQRADYDNAEKYFNKVLDIDEGAAKAYRLDKAFLTVGTYYQQAGQIEKAIKNFSLSLRLNEKNIKVYLMLALLHSNRGDNGLALEYLEKAREIDGQDEELIRFLTGIHNRIGNDYLAKNMNAEARAEFEKVLAIDSSDLYAIYYLGYLDYLQKDMEGAALRLGKLTALKIDDENLKQGIKPLLFNIGAYYLQNEKYEKARLAMEKVLMLFPDYSKAYYYLGLAAFNMADYDRAIDVFEKTLALEPSNSGAVKQLGKAYDEARKLHFEKGKELYQAKKYREALAELDRTIQISPDFAPAQKYRDAVLAAFEVYRKEEEARLGATTSVLIKEARSLLDEGELLSAKGKLLKLKEIDPLNGEVDLLLKASGEKISARIEANLIYARAQVGAEEYYKAIVAYKEVVFFEPENSEALAGISLAAKKLTSQVDAIKKAAEAFMSKESFREALDSYSKVLKLNPEEKSALAGRQLALSRLDLFYDEYLGMGRDYEKLEQFSEALSYFNKALNLKPGDSVALSSIGNVRQKMGSLKGIEEMLKAARKAFSAGRLNEAISGFMNVLKLDADNKYAKKGLKEARSSRRGKVDSLLSRASSLYEGGRYKETVDLCREILTLDAEEKEAAMLLSKARNAINSRANPLIAKGKKLFDEGSLDEAVIVFTRAMRSDPGNMVAQRYLSKVEPQHLFKVIAAEINRAYLNGIDRYTSGKYEDALQFWNDVLDLDPSHEKALLNIGKARKKLAAIKGE
ncbi:MAG: tetratricopeptide repeat protein [bacterium]|nr:tetratricopeptide repeat protein [bacterium]